MPATAHAHAHRRLTQCTQDFYIGVVVRRSCEDAESSRLPVGLACCPVWVGCTAQCAFFDSDEIYLLLGGQPHYLPAHHVQCTRYLCSTRDLFRYTTNCFTWLPTSWVDLMFAYTYRTLCGKRYRTKAHSIFHEFATEFHKTF